jgi:hypothetical protein
MESARPLPFKPLRGQLNLFEIETAALYPDLALA